MSGHSKWHQIRRQKGVNDSKRGQLFTRLGRELVVAVRERAIDAVRVMLDAGANPNKTAADHTSAMLVATMNGDYNNRTTQFLKRLEASQILLVEWENELEIRLGVPLVSHGVGYRWYPIITTSALVWLYSRAYFLSP